MTLSDPDIGDVLVAHQHMLGERLVRLLSVFPLALRRDVEVALREPGKVLSTASHASSRIAGMWPLVTLELALTLAPDVNVSAAAVPAALALECFICALDLLDDIEDGDRTNVVAQLGSARVLNVSSALLALALRSLSQVETLSPTTTAPLVFHLQQTLTTALQDAVSGQHSDLLAENEDDRFERMTPEESIDACTEIARRKAGALMRLAFQLAALVAQTDAACSNLCAEIGEVAGIGFQFANDCHALRDFLDAGVSRRDDRLTFNSTDIARRKKTLPLVLARQYQLLQKSTPRSDYESQEADALYDGFIAAWGIRLLKNDEVRSGFARLEHQLGTQIRPLLFALLGLGAEEELRDEQ